jgi:hypothetical protein
MRRLSLVVIGLLLLWWVHPLRRLPHSPTGSSLLVVLQRSLSLWFLWLLLLELLLEPWTSRVRMAVGLYVRRTRLLLLLLAHRIWRRWLFFDCAAVQGSLLRLLEGAAAAVTPAILLVYRVIMILLVIRRQEVIEIYGASIDVSPRHRPRKIFALASLLLVPIFFILLSGGGGGGSGSGSGPHRLFHLSVRRARQGRRRRRHLR